jgi:hypothetical protein
MSIGSYYSSITSGLLGLYRKAQPDPSREFVGVIQDRSPVPKAHVLSLGCDDVVRNFGPRVYRAMLTDPAASSSYNSLRLSILDGGVNLVPTHKPPAASRRPKPMVPKTADPESDSEDGDSKDGSHDPAQLTPEQARSKEITDFCQRCLDRLGDDLGPSLMGLLAGMAFGVKLAETTLLPVMSGEDKGRLGIGSFRVKPDWAWRFVVDPAMNVTGIVTWDAATTSYVVVDPAKFSWFTWMPEDNDPRGTSVLRAAYDAWNQKIQHWPDYYKFLKRFGSPSIAAIMAEFDKQRKVDVDAEGLEVTDGTLISASDHMIKVLGLLQSGGVVAVPYGTEIFPLEPKSEGDAFLKSFDLFDRQICLAIQLQARTSLEAKHGSKADSESAQDTKGLVVPYGRNVLEGAIRKALRFAVVANFGPEDAAEYTPHVELGSSEQQDKATLWGAAGSLWSTGYLGESQREELDAEIGLPPRDPESDAEAAAMKLKAQQEIASASAPPGGPPKPGDPKPQPKPGAEK